VQDESLVDTRPPMPRYIGIVGKAGHGKDTVARFINEHFNGVYKCMGFADPLKIMLWALEWHHTLLKEQEPWTIPPDLYVRQLSQSIAKQEPIGPLANKHTKAPTRGQMLQTLGTEWGRKLVHQDLWVKLADYRMASTWPQPCIFTDVRFPNELSLLKDKQALIIHIYRPYHIEPGRDALHESEALNKLLADEVSLLAAYFPDGYATIVNNRDLTWLQERVTRLCSFYTSPTFWEDWGYV